MKSTEWNRLLDLYSIEDGNCFNTGSRLTMKPLAKGLPRAGKRTKTERSAKPSKKRRVAVS